MSKSLVVYFSASGVTASIAQDVARIANADIFEIKPVIPYSKEDLNWMDKNARSTIEMQDCHSRPEISESINNIEDYDTIFLGFPIWWYVAPTIVNTFLESYNLYGKTIRPFFTSGGSGAGQTDERLHVSAPDAIWRPAKRLYAGNEARLKEWVEDISI